MHNRPGLAVRTACPLNSAPEFAGSNCYHQLHGRGGVPRAPVDRILYRKHACCISVLPPDASQEMPWHLDNLLRCDRHFPTRHGPSWTSAGCERSMAPRELFRDIYGSPIPVRLAQNGIAAICERVCSARLLLARSPSRSHTLCVWGFDSLMSVWPQAHFLYYSSDLSPAGEIVCAHNVKHQKASERKDDFRDCFTARLRIEHGQQQSCPY